MSKVIVERDGAVRTVTLNRPEKRNALDVAMLDELEAAFPPDPPAEERVAVLRAAGWGGRCRARERRATKAAEGP